MPDSMRGSYVKTFPEVEGYYWADNGVEVRMVYAEKPGERWLIWDPLEGADDSMAVKDFVQWAGRLRPPELDDYDYTND